MGVTVRYNYFGAIAYEMPRNIDDAVLAEAEDIAKELKSILWIDTGLVRRVTVARDLGRYHAEVWIGYNRGHGFYSRFQEWGTRKQVARPIVGPTAHRHEPIYKARMTEAVREACRARG
jgi:HK97 gp10 family phage protein